MTTGAAAAKEGSQVTTKSEQDSETNRLLDKSLERLTGKPVHVSETVCLRRGTDKSKLFSFTHDRSATLTTLLIIVTMTTKVLDSLGSTHFNPNRCIFLRLNEVVFVPKPDQTVTAACVLSLFP